MNTRALSYSRISTFLGCVYNYNKRYEEGVRKRFDAAYLRRGSLVDNGIEAAIRAQEDGADEGTCAVEAAEAVALKGKEWLEDENIAPWLENVPGLETEALELIAECQLIAIRAVEDLELGTGRWQTLWVPDMKNPDPEADQVLGVQFKVTHPLEAWEEGYQGYVDWLARDTKTGHIWLIDFKVRKQMQPEESLEFDLQLPTYQYCIEKMIGEPVTGCAHYQIRAAVPKRPPLLKPKITKKNPNALSAGVSRNKSIATNWKTYRQTVIEEGFDPADYLDMRDALSEFERFTTCHRSVIELEQTWAEVEAAAAKISEHHARLDNMGPERISNLRRLNIMQCRGCQMQDLCLGELRGHDTAEILRNDFYILGQEPTEPPPPTTPSVES